MNTEIQGAVSTASDISARILIVDDETAQMRALCNTLQDHHFETTGFDVPREALAAIQKPGRFDLILADLMMPEMDGISLLKAALEMDPEMVGVVMTGQGTIDTAVKAMKAGAVDYILKPFKLSAILPVLSRALAIRRLRAENIELTRRVRKHTAELEEANKELEAFSYSVSHDLRAPLRAVDGFTGMVLARYSEQMPPEAKRLLGQVESSAKRMGQLIEDLLRFSRLSRQPLSNRRVNISEMVADIVRELRLEAGDREVEVRIGELPDVTGDVSLLRQVFVNLLSNAFKFTRKTKALVEVGCETAGEENVFFVRDNGAGFDMAYAQKLFTVFHRMHTEDQFEGTGVGLSIVQRIVQRHGGRVWAHAEPGKGASFHVALPKTEVD
ncbi:MAG TPA: ATP-binding protein [Verrucomicrobiae bacterium]|jgi:signal transduction histidine kinase|nr:ATP-binding protein [Verrucomicrobiae bacterium]